MFKNFNFPFIAGGLSALRLYRREHNFETISKRSVFDQLVMVKIYQCGSSSGLLMSF